MKMRTFWAAAAAAVGSCVVSIAILGVPGAESGGGTLKVYNWGEYIDEDVITQFEDETGISVVYDVFETNEEMYPVVEAGGVKYDVVCPSDYMIQRMIDNNMLAELDPLTAGSRRVWGRPSFSEMFIALFARKYRKYYSKIVFLPKLLINRNSVASPDRTPRPPKLQLPFEQKKNDAGEWAYDHRIGLCVTLIAYLVLAIAFMVGKIVVGAKPSVQGIIIDTKTLAELEAEKMRLEQEVRARQQAQEGGDWRDVRNQYSNENALEERSRDDRGSMSSSLKESAEAVGERMQANRDAYEQGLAEERAIRERMGRSGKDDRTQDSRAKGRVTVSFSLTDPVRTRRYLEVPAYQCEGGGEVVVGITVNPSGEVVAAKVASGGDDCMREAALEAARNSLFNIDDSAPARQSGTITYLFIPQ